MAPTAKGGHSNRTTSSTSAKPPVSSFAGLDTNVAINGENTDKKKLAKRGSVFYIGSTGSPAVDAADDEPSTLLNNERPKSPSSRPRTLHKVKTNSVFGSLGKKAINSLKEKSLEHLDYNPGPIIYEEGQIGEQINNGGGKKVLHHGEVQTTSGLFRKKKEYLVLTETHLVRYKSLSRAAEAFPSIPLSFGRSSTNRHASTTSIGSLQDVQSINSHVSIEGDNAIPLKQIVTAYKVEDGRPFFTTEVVYLDEESSFVGSIQLMLNDPKEADLWHTSIRGAAQKARLTSVQPYPERVVVFLVNILEAALDYDAAHFTIFRVVRRASSRAGGRSSTDDFSKLGSSVSYMVVGINQLHLVSLPDFAESSTRTLDAKASKSRYGLVSLVSIDVQHADDTFQLGFRKPLEAPVLLELAASSSPEIAAVIFRAIQYLKPQWLDPTFLFSGPRGLLDDNDMQIPLEDDNGGFDRTLVAYCAAYRCNATNIRYAIDLDTEDAPEFRLMPPANSLTYTILELLAIFRALRYNECFHSISFQGIDLQKLHGLLDSSGEDHVAWTSRSGLPIRTYFNIMPGDKSLLYQEIQALALKTQRVRRMNFSNTLPRRRPRDDIDDEGAVKDPGCEIAAALLPLCRRQLTNVDWIIFSGIDLGETDLAEFILALNERQSHFRCIEVSRCALSDRGLQVFMNYLEKQNATMECINIADNPGRIHLEKFPITMSRFSQIRKLDLSRVTSTCGTEALIAPEIMLTWRLEEMILTGVPINQKTLDSICTYLASDMSNYMHHLQLDQCHLSGIDVAILMRSMSRNAGEARELHLIVSANRLEKGGNEIANAIEQNRTPAHLTMRLIEYQTESRFRQLLQALRHNVTIRKLDISKTSLPYDAGDETCKALQSLFEDNETLAELDISGEHAHLETARFGIGLNFTLNGLTKNKALKVLKIEYQNLGLEGANTLSSVLEENETLTHIYCDHNGINLQGFTVLVNTMAKNFSILDMPLMLDDQRAAVKRMTSAITGVGSSAKSQGTVKQSVRRTLNTLGMHLKDNPLPTPQDVEQAVQILTSRWQRQIERLLNFLERNQKIAAGLEIRETYLNDDTLRPTTAMSDAGILDHVLFNTTPKAERTNPIDTTRKGGMDHLMFNGENENDSENRKVMYDETGEAPAVKSRSRSGTQQTMLIPKFELGDMNIPRSNE